MQALQTPFLITSSALAVSATTGDLADELIGGLHSKGVDGLALWPTDLRHPVSFGAPLVSPADFKGIEFRIPGSTIAKLTVTTLGAVPVDEFDASVRGGDSGFRRAPGLPRPNTFTGNVTFNPRVDVLVIASSAFDALSAARQTAVRAAASSTRQHMIDSIVPDKDQAKSYCADLGGAVVLASAAQLQAFRTALAPVEATIAGDALGKKLIDTVRTLGRGVAPEAAVSPCGTPGK